MKIVMFTNTFSPHVGGVAHSVSGLAEGMRERGHRVLVVAPVFSGTPEIETDVIRIPALQHFGGSDFSVPIPASKSLVGYLNDFQPDLIHSHHPFLLGSTALRVSAARDLPVIYTHHTRYDLYGHYIKQNSALMKRLALSLTLGYCDLCDAVIAPSQSAADFLDRHNVSVPTVVIPTGVKIDQFEHGKGKVLREELGIPKGAFVVGHVGRLAQEKNLDYLTRSLIRFLESNHSAFTVIVGEGPMRDQMRRTVDRSGLSRRVHFTGAMIGKRLANAYAAMDVFAFSSLSETQGLVLTEAMSSGTPVVALDAPGACDVIDNGRNGHLLPRQASTRHFAAVLNSVANLGTEERLALQVRAFATSRLYTRDRSVSQTLGIYNALLSTRSSRFETKSSKWMVVKRVITEEWKILTNVVRAVEVAVLKPDRI